MFLQYNAVYDIAISADAAGMLDYWSGVKSDLAFPKNIDFEYKTDTDLFEFVMVSELSSWWVVTVTTPVTFCWWSAVFAIICVIVTSASFYIFFSLHILCSQQNWEEKGEVRGEEKKRDSHPSPPSLLSTGYIFLWWNFINILLLLYN